jgi:hypothetical protein
MRLLAVGLLLFVLYPSGAFASFTGLVVAVLDGGHHRSSAQHPPGARPNLVI